VEAIAPVQPEARAMHDLAMTIDEARSVVERAAGIKGEEFFFDGNSRIACGGNRI
jgi:hypothetical protein